MHQTSHSTLNLIISCIVPEKKTKQDKRKEESADEFVLKNSFKAANTSDRYFTAEKTFANQGYYVRSIEN